MDRVGDAHHLIFWPVSDFFWGSERSYQKGGVGRLLESCFFFFCTDIFGMTPKSC